MTASMTKRTFGVSITPNIILNGAWHDEISSLSCRLWDIFLVWMNVFTNQEIYWRDKNLYQIEWYIRTWCTATKYFISLLWCCCKGAFQGHKQHDKIWWARTTDVSNRIYYWQRYEQKLQIRTNWFCVHLCCLVVCYS